MGTRFECVLGGFVRPVDSAKASAIAEAIEELVLDEHRRLSIFDPKSCISEVNRTARTRPILLDPDLFELLQRCLGYAFETQSAFDITAGLLMHAYGFRRNTAALTSQQPSRPFVLDPKQKTIHFQSDSTSLDLGGVAKGYALDLVLKELTEHGVINALIHGGTSSATSIGCAPDGEPWRVRLFSDDPLSPTIELVDRSLACSSPRGRTADGHGHIMNTRTGQPAAGVDAACVLGASAETCEAWSTALVVDAQLARLLPVGYEAHVLIAGQWHFHQDPSVTTMNPRNETLTHA